MNTLLEWFGSENWAHIIKALLHTLWVGVVVGGCLAVVLHRTNDPVKRYRASLGALFLVLLGGLVAWAIVQQRPLTPKNSPVTSAPEIATSTAREPANPVESTLVAQAAPQSELIMQGRPHWVAYVALVWLVGTVAMLLRAAWLVAGAERLRRTTRPLQDVRVLQVVEELSAALRLMRKVRVVVTEQLASPAVLGVFVPTLVLPLSLVTTLSQPQLQAILLHELAHIQRGDYFVNLCQLIAESVLFFNPAVWWISRQIRIEREACCDAVAVSVTSEKIEYARTLLSVAERMSAELPAAAAAFGDRRNRGGLKDRMRRLLDPAYRPPIRLTWPALLGSVFCGTLVLVVSAAGTLWTVTAAAKLLTPQERVARIENTMRKLDQLSAVPSDNTETISVTAKLTTIDGSPLPPGTHPVFHTFSPHSSGSYGASLDKDGLCKATVPRCELYFAASASGFAPAALGPFDLRRTNQLENVELVLDRGFDVKVRVVDASSKHPISDAEVKASFWVRSTSSFEPLTVITDASGEAILHHCSSLKMSLLVRKAGFESVNETIQKAKAGDTFGISMRRAGLVAGTVTSATSRQPIAGASFYLLGADGESAEPGTNPRYLGEPLVKSGSDGHFAVDRLRRGTRYWLLVAAPKHAEAVLSEVSPGMTNLQVTLQPEIIVRGKITGDLSGLRRTRTGPSLWVTQRYLMGDRSTHEAGEDVPCRLTNGIGYFEFTNRLAGPVTINIGPKSFERDVTASIDDWVIDLNAVSVTTNKIREVVLRFAHPSGVAPKGTIELSLPSERANNAYGKTVEITNGEIRCEAIVGRYFAYEPRQTIGYWFKQQSIFSLPDGDSPLIISVPAVPAGAIYAQARNVDGSLVSDCFFSVVEVKKSPLADPTSFSVPNGDGFSPDSSVPRKFVASPLPLQGTYLIIAHRDNNFSISDRIELTESSPDKSVELQFRPGVTIRGKVVSVTDEPMPQVRVRLDWRHKLHGVGLDTIRTDQNGGFMFADCTPHVGEYTIEVHEPGMQSVRVPVNLTSLPLKVKLKPGLKLSGQFVDAQSGRPILDAEVRALAESDGLPMETTKTDGSGRFEFSTLQDTKYRVHVDGAYFSAGSPLLRAGQQAPTVLRVTLVQGATVKLGPKEN